LHGTADADETTVLCHPTRPQIIRPLLPAGNNDANDVPAIALLADDIEQTERGGTNVVFDAVNDFSLVAIGIGKPCHGAVVINAEQDFAAARVIEKRDDGMLEFIGEFALEFEAVGFGVIASENRVKDLTIRISGMRVGMARQTQRIKGLNRTDIFRLSQVDFISAGTSFPFMLIAEKQLASAALGLPPRKRARLADALMQSLESKRDIEFAAAWNAEADSRARAFRRGELRAVSVEKAFGFKL